MLAKQARYAYFELILRLQSMVGCFGNSQRLSNQDFLFYMDDTVYSMRLCSTIVELHTRDIKTVKDAASVMIEECKHIRRALGSHDTTKT